MKGSHLVGRLICAALAVLVFLLPAGLSAQTVNGSFRGTVSDPTGAVVPGATIKMSDTAKGVSRETKTDASGYYEFLSVPLSAYDFTVSYTGFQTLANQGVVLLVNQNATSDFTSRPGTVMQQFTVSSQAPLFNAINSTVRRE